MACPLCGHQAAAMAQMAMGFGMSQQLQQQQMMLQQMQQQQLMQQQQMPRPQCCRCGEPGNTKRVPWHPKNWRLPAWWMMNPNGFDLLREVEVTKQLHSGEANDAAAGEPAAALTVASWHTLRWKIGEEAPINVRSSWETMNIITFHRDKSHLGLKMNKL